jgi:CubicO group peptidase (beta-lactamase class C family)
MKYGLLLAFAAIFSAALVFAYDCDSMRDHRIEQYLSNIAGNDSAALFSVLPRHGTIKTYAAGPIRKESYLRFGSISKIFTSDLWFDQVRHRRGGIRAALEAVVGDLVSPQSLYEGSNIITYRQVLSMTSGIHEFTFNIGYNETSGQFIPPQFSIPINIDLGWKNVSLDFAPGSYYLYSNTNCEVVGATVNRLAQDDIRQLLKQKWRHIAPSLKYDDGTVPESSWPGTSGYTPWFYPVSLPGVSGSLVGQPEDLLKAFQSIVEDRETLNYRRQWTTAPVSTLPGAGVAGGDKYGLFWQRYSSIGLLGAEGHDGDYVVRSIVVHDPSREYCYLFHFAQPMINPVLVEHTKNLVNLYHNL